MNNKNLRQVIALNIRKHRAKLHLSQEKLAENCGLHRTFIGSIERAERNITLSTLEAIAAGLNIEVVKLLEDAENNIGKRK